MKLSNLLVLIQVLSFITSPASAAVVHFKNGEIIECESFTRRGDTLFVNINGDKLVDFPVDEIDLGKTSLAPGRKKPATTAPRTRSTAKATGSSDNGSWTGSFALPVPEGSTPCPPGLQNELLARFARYNRAAEAGDFAEWGRQITRLQAEKTREKLAGLSEPEYQKRKRSLQEMAVRKYRPAACLVSPDADTAVMVGRGTKLFLGTTSETNGTVLFNKEDQSWKIKSAVWNHPPK
ncbi:hypothetical protein [Geomesophilobacter sediminis]|uniref:DUF4878 domain-containing protein n=1 Tax=Geomesophilobacter sediminis TaxID=2798584 RepID=A0A8J7LVE5_9BACT|nr:hypothetical protein [Geomesophilobacter sediminis]MBJ6724915.1 hypothetical protein [Geomesophilobacter sediminis]